MVVKMAERRTRPKELAKSFTELYKQIEPKIAEAIKVDMRRARQTAPRPRTSPTPRPLREQRRG